MYNFWLAFVKFFSSYNFKKIQSVVNPLFFLISVPVIQRLILIITQYMVVEKQIFFVKKNVKRKRRNMLEFFPVM